MLSWLITFLIVFALVKLVSHILYNSLFYDNYSYKKRLDLELDQEVLKIYKNILQIVKDEKFKGMYIIKISNRNKFEISIAPSNIKERISFKYLVDNYIEISENINSVEYFQSEEFLEIFYNAIDFKNKLENSKVNLDNEIENLDIKINIIKDINNENN